MVLPKFRARQKYLYVHLLNIVVYIIFIRKIYFSFTYQSQFSLPFSHPSQHFLFPLRTTPHWRQGLPATKSGKSTRGRNSFPHFISRFSKVSHQKEWALKGQCTHLGYVLLPLPGQTATDQSS